MDFLCSVGYWEGEKGKIGRDTAGVERLAWKRYGVRAWVIIIC